MSTRIGGQTVVFLSLLVCLSTVSIVFAESPYNVVWGRQIGTPDHDFSNAVAADTLGNLFLPWTHDAPPIGDNSLHYDTAINKYDFGGRLTWERSYDSTVSDLISDITADNLGNAYVAGAKYLEATGQHRAVHSDGFIRKVDTNGLTLWESSFGSEDSDEIDSIFAGPLGDIFVSGQTNGALGTANAGGNDAYVSKFDSSGNQLWLKQFGTDLTEVAWDVSGDKLGNVFISGTTFGMIGAKAYGSADTFTIKLDSDGNTLWKRQWGSASYDQSYAVQADGDGGAYIAGYGLRAFVARYNSSGDLVWINYLNSAQGDSSNNLAVDDAGNVYVLGSTRGVIGAQQFGGVDAFLSKLAADGDLLWTAQFGSEANDVASGLTVDFNRDAYVSGLTWGSLAGSNLGGGDAFLVKLSNSYIPEPSHQTLLVFVLTCAACRRRCGRKSEHSIY